MQIVLCVLEGEGGWGEGGNRVVIIEQRHTYNAVCTVHGASLLLNIITIYNPVVYFQFFSMVLVQICNIFLFDLYLNV